MNVFLDFCFDAALILVKSFWKKRIENVKAIEEQCKQERLGRASTEDPIAFTHTHAEDAHSKMEKHDHTKPRGKK